MYRIGEVGSVCVCVCVYIYIYIYTHTHTHTHTKLEVRGDVITVLKRLLNMYSVVDWIQVTGAVFTIRW